jgi:hypothetical protein
MKIRPFAPLIAIAFVILLVTGISLTAEAIISDQETDYLIKPVVKESVFYVQPRLSKYLQPRLSWNLSPEVLLSSLAEIEQNYAISTKNLHVKTVKGMDIPGLLVFVNPIVAQQAEVTETIALTD